MASLQSVIRASNPKRFLSISVQYTAPCGPPLCLLFFIANWTKPQPSDDTSKCYFEGRPASQDEWTQNTLLGLHPPKDINHILLLYTFSHLEVGQTDYS